MWWAGIPLASWLLIIWRFIHVQNTLLGGSRCILTASFWKLWKGRRCNVWPQRFFEPVERNKTVWPQPVCGKSVCHGDGHCPLLHFTGHGSLGPIIVCLPPTIRHKYGEILTCRVGELMLPTHETCGWKGKWGTRGHSKCSKQNLSRMYKSESVVFQWRAGEDWLL